MQLSQLNQHLPPSTMISTQYNMYQIIYLLILLLSYTNRIVVESFSSLQSIAITTNSRKHYTSSLSRCSKRSSLSMSAGEATLPMPIEGEGTYCIALYDVYYLAAMYGFSWAARRCKNWVSCVIEHLLLGKYV